MPKFVDIHSHLNFPEYDVDRDAVISRMRDAGVWTITVGTNLETSRSAVALADSPDGRAVGIFACIGLHPADDPAALWDEATAAAFAELARHPRVVAIGECGLDYFRIGTRRDGTILTADEIAAVKQRQRNIFLAQIDLALAADKPLMIHCRDAYDDVYEILAARKVRANLHFFAGNLATAEKFLAIGCTLSFTGVVTFARDYDDVIRATPLDRIMSETDAPFVAPAPYRGKRNEPAYVPEVARKLAEIKGIDPAEMQRILVENAQKTFNLG